MGGLDEASRPWAIGISTAPGTVDTVTNEPSNRILPMGFVRIGELDREFDLGLLGSFRDPSGGNFGVYGPLRR